MKNNQRGAYDVENSKRHRHCEDLTNITKTVIYLTLLYEERIFKYDFLKFSQIF